LFLEFLCRLRRKSMARRLVKCWSSNTLGEVLLAWRAAADLSLAMKRRVDETMHKSSFYHTQLAAQARMQAGDNAQIPHPDTPTCVLTQGAVPGISTPLSLASVPRLPMPPQLLRGLL